MQKQELIKKIAGYEIPASKLKLSRLYIVKLEKEEKKIFKFGKAMNVESRVKDIQKDLTEWKVDLLWNSQAKGLMWLDAFTMEMEKLIHFELRGAFEMYANKYDDRPRGFSEMYDYNVHTDKEIVKWIESTIIAILSKKQLKSLADLPTLRGKLYA